MFASVAELKRTIALLSPDEFVEQKLLTGASSHFDSDRIEHTAQILSQEYRIDVSDSELHVVGSAKIGYALHDKKKEGKDPQPAFRPYDQNSDIDLAICCPKLFERLWYELNAHFCRKSYIPFESGKVGDYLCYGWLRLDRLPRSEMQGLGMYRRLLETIAVLRKDTERGHPKLEIGVFHDREHLRMYQVRSVGSCRQKLESPL